jgi:hypothetical protein
MAGISTSDGKVGDRGTNINEVKMGDSITDTASGGSGKLLRNRT